MAKRLANEHLALSMDGSQPFLQMTEFRKECFQSFPVTHVQRMSLSQVFQARAEEGGEAGEG
jgi:hypothetical protein